MKRLRIKAGNINNLTDARYFASWNVDWLGLDLSGIIAENSLLGFISGIREWIVGPELIGEFKETDLNKATATILDLKLDGLDISEKDIYDPSVIKEIPGIKCFVRFKIREGNSPESTLSRMEEIYRPNVFFIFEMNEVKESMPAPSFSTPDINDQYPVLISCTQSSRLIDLVKNSPGLFGIQVKGGTEEKTGYKSFDDLDMIFDFLEQTGQIYLQG